MRSPTGCGRTTRRFIARDLSDIEVEYLFVDAVFESLRRHGAKEALLVCWGIDSDGRKHLLHLAVGNKESERCWTELFRNLLERGMRLPTTITSDGAPGLIAAINTVFAKSHPDQVLVPSIGQHPRQAARRDCRRGPCPPPRGARRPHPGRRPGCRGPVRQHVLTRVPGRGRPASPTTWTRCWPSTGSRSGTASVPQPRRTIEQRPRYSAAPAERGGDAADADAACR